MPSPHSADGAVPTEAELRRTLDRILSRPEFEIDSAPESSDLSMRVLHQIINWILAPFRWLFDLTEGMPDIVRWLISSGLFALLLLLAGHIGWTLYRAMGGRGGLRSDASRLRGHERVLRPEEYESAAARAAEQGEIMEAVRLLFRACLSRLELHERRSFRRGTTNREHLKRYRHTQFFTPMEKLVVTIERKWYGSEPCVADDLVACQAAHAQVRSILRETPPC